MTHPQARIMKGDLYTCGSLQDKEIRLFIKSILWFKPIYLNYQIFERSKKMKLLSESTLDADDLKQ
jgi:hypothetical protein